MKDGQKQPGHIGQNIGGEGHGFDPTTRAAANVLHGALEH